VAGALDGALGEDGAATAGITAAAVSPPAATSATAVIATLLVRYGIPNIEKLLDWSLLSLPPRPFSDAAATTGLSHR
jgi:hypothetical protein